MQKRLVLSFGEILWDALPAGLFLGGAPLNVSYHLNQMGLKGVIASRVGRDRLGEEALRRIQNKGMETRLIQRDSFYETGFAEVDLDADGNAEFDIIEPVAWDNIRRTDELVDFAGKAWAIVFGTLAQRRNSSKATLHAILQSDALKVFDVNLRFPHFDRGIVEESLDAADVLKLNREELDRFIEWFDLPEDKEEALGMLAESFDLNIVAVTNGDRGAFMCRNDSIFKVTGIDVNVADTVGAGDAFVAGLIAGLGRDRDGNRLLSLANAAGAFTASTTGATPEYTGEQIKKLAKEHEESA